MVLLVVLNEGYQEIMAVNDLARTDHSRNQCRDQFQEPFSQGLIGQFVEDGKGHCGQWGWVVNVSRHLSEDGRALAASGQRSLQIMTVMWKTRHSKKYFSLVYEDHVGL
jgi:hypothetical protein